MHMDIQKKYQGRRGQMIRACPPLYPSLLYTKICVDRKEKLPAFELWLLFFFFFCSEKNFGYLKNSK